MPPLYSLPGKLKEHCVDLSLHPTPDHATLKPVREAEGVRSPVPSTRSKGLQRLHAEADQPASRPLGWQPPRPRGRAAFSNDHRMEAHSWVFQACAVGISGSLSQIQTLVPVVVRDTGTSGSHTFLGHTNSHIQYTPKGSRPSTHKPSLDFFFFFLINFVPENKKTTR